MQNSTSSLNRFDEIRASNPVLGFALYALDTDGPVTFEVVTPSVEIYTFKGATAEEAMALAFPVDGTSAPANSDAGEPLSIFD